MKFTIKHPFSRNLTLASFAAMASLALASHASGQGGIAVKKLPTDAVTTKKSTGPNGIESRPSKTTQENATRPEGVSLSIREFSAVRDSGSFTNKIRLKAVVSNVGAKTSSPTPYTIYRWEPAVWKDGRQTTAKWAPIRRGTVNAIATNMTDPILIDLDMDFRALHYKLEIVVPDLPGAAMAQTSRGIPTRGSGVIGTARPTITKESNRLPEVLFVVQYRAEKEVLVREWKNFNYQADGNKADSPLMVEARHIGQGFKTRLPYRAHERPALPPLPLSETTGLRDYSLYVSLPDWKERTFPTPEAAARFRSELPQVAGVEIKSVTR